MTLELSINLHVRILKLWTQTDRRCEVAYTLLWTVTQLMQFPYDQRASICEAIWTEIETSQLKDIRDSWKIFHEIMLWNA